MQLLRLCRAHETDTLLHVPWIRSACHGLMFATIFLSSSFNWASITAPLFFLCSVSEKNGADFEFLMATSFRHLLCSRRRVFFRYPRHEKKSYTRIQFQHVFLQPFLRCHHDATIIDTSVPCGFPPFPWHRHCGHWWLSLYTASFVFQFHGTCL